MCLQVHIIVPAGTLYVYISSVRINDDLVKYTPIRSVSCCPAFLMAIAGPYVAVSGAVFTDRFISEPLLDYTLIGPQFSSSTEGRFSAGVRKVAHLMETLELCIDELEDYYQKLSYQSLTYPVSIRLSFISALDC